MIDTIIFDMDGTLIDSEKYWKDIEYDFICDLIEGWDEEKHDRIMGRSLTDLHKGLCKYYGLCLSKEQFFSHYDDMGKKVYGELVDLLPGCKDFIEKVHKNDYTLGIASSSQLSFIDIVIDRFKIRDYFTHIGSVEELECKGKPAPDVYLHAAKKMKKEPKNCLVIEDAKPGFEGAKNAGMKCIAIKNGHNDNQDMKSVDYIAKKYHDISIKLIKGL